MASTPDTQQDHWHYTELSDRDFQLRGRTVFFVIVLFAVVLLFSLLYIYARWVCRYYRHHFPTETSSHAPHAPFPVAPRGLDTSSIRSLPITLYKSPGISCANAECCICLGGFEEGEKVKVLPWCGHCFHSECVDRWLVAHSSCPLCRASLLDHSHVVVGIVAPNSLVE